MIQVLSIATTFLAAVCSALAAYHWYRAAQVEAPIKLEGVSGWGGPTTVDATPLAEFASESGRRNKVAALWSAAAGAFAGLAWALGTYLSWTAPPH